MKKMFLAVVITATIMLAACSSDGNLEETSGTGSNGTETEDTEGTTTPEATVTETTAGTVVTETTVDEPVQAFEYITFGHYEQDGDESNGPEPIEWMVLSEEDGRMLLLSRYILDYQAYNVDYDDVTWETCTLRKWLNEDFYNAAFDASEQEQILTVTNSNPENVSPYSNSVGGNDTEDKIFLLSSDEADTLFINDDARAVDDCDWWWLRSPGYINNRAAVVLTIGEIYNHGHIVSFNYYDHGVRPAFWLDLDT